MKQFSLAAVAAAAIAVVGTVSITVPAQAFGQHPYHHMIVHRRMHHAAVVRHRMMHHAAVVHHRMVHHILHHG